jgi:choice-of-anchor C domain-containing protein
MRRVIMGILSAALLTVALGSTVLGAAFDHGSFDQSNYTSGESWGQMVQEGQDNITGWKVTGEVDLVNDYWPAHTPNFSIDLNGYGRGAISQDLDTIAGKHYFVQFQLAGNPTDNDDPRYRCEINDPKRMTVSVDGGQAEQFTFVTAGHSLANVGWRTEGYTFKAPDGTTTLKFQSDVAEGACGPAVDTIKVTQVLLAGEDCKDGGWKLGIDRDATHISFKNQGDCVSFFATGEKNLANPRD